MDGKTYYAQITKVYLLIFALVLQHFYDESF